MNNFDFEPSWKDIYFLVYPHEKKDKSFSSKDLIRFYHHNLSWSEQLEVKEYFCEIICAEQLPKPEPILPPVPPSFPLLPIPICPVLLPPPPPSLPPPPPPLIPPPETCPPFPTFLSPVYPWIIIPGIDPDILRDLKEILGIKEAEATILNLKEDLKYWKKMYWYDYGQYVPKGVRPSREPTYLWGDEPQIDTEVSQNGAEVSQNDAEVFDDPFFTEDRQDEIEEEWDWDKEYEEWEDLQEEKEAEGGEDTTLIPDLDEKILFYELVRSMEEECDRIGISFVWRFWVVHWGRTWYYFEIEGEAFEWTIDELPGVLEVLRNIDTLDEMQI